MLQHVWTYKPLLQDVLGLKRNRVSVAAEGEPGQGGAAASQQKHYQVDEGDFFWQGNGLKPFPAVAEQVEVELARYRASVEELNRQTGADVDPLADPSELMGSSTKNLMSAISSLPQLTEQKRVIDKHTNLATALLGAIKTRALDRFYELAEELVGGKGGVDAVLKALQPAAPGLPGDKLRLALVWLLTAQPAPQEAEAGRVEEALRSLGVDARAFAYAWRMRRLNLTGKAHAAPSVAEGLVSLGAGSAQLGNLLGSTFGQGLSSLTKGVKSLLAGEQQAAVTVALEALMDSRPRPETESFLLLDPRGQPGQPTHVSGGFREAIVFMLGGGNYLEAESLACWASRAQPAPKHVVYGATDLLSGDEFVQQLAQLAAMSGTG
ncbi:Sec1 family protein [Helicosporidium sp. ATCC 50920]|nr:Sec1 family protein [Helicosporidium sp. ATCC 50920]|eukprot:KDD76262.1 Sec1 family protein [Helicosporidium sp. ATCC 50920]